MKTSMILLAGPPGVGKSTLGRRVCDDLGLRFLDFSAPDKRPLPADASLADLLAGHPADVVALSWAMQERGPLLASARQQGTLLLLWAHPLEMRERSGRQDLFTPRQGLSTHGGFGREGTSCIEFRRLRRACQETLYLRGLSIATAAECLREAIGELRQERDLPPAEQEGIAFWAKHWQTDTSVDRATAEIVTDAMARYLIQLRAQGASPRTIAGVTSDLNAAGLVVLGWGTCRPGRQVLHAFIDGSSEYDFKRKISDSPGSVARYGRTLQGFANFLREARLVEDEGS